MRKLFTLISMLLLASCTDPNTTTVNGNLPTGDLHGKVKAMANNDSAISDQSGIKVLIEGTSFNATTDDEGEWVIHGLPSATYNISFSKDGFGTYRQMAYSHLGGAPSRLIGPIQIFPMPKCAPVFDSIVDVKRAYMRLYSHVPCATAGSLIVLYFSNTRDVSSARGKHAFSMIAHSGGALGAGDELLYDDMFSPKGTFADFGIDPQDSIFVVAYTLGGYSMYTDPVTNETIYPAMYHEASPVLGFRRD